MNNNCGGIDTENQKLLYELYNFINLMNFFSTYQLINFSTTNQPIN